MHIDRFEKLWITISISFLILLFVIIGYTALAHGVHVPTSEAHQGHSDSHTEEDVANREPGIYPVGDNHYQVVIRAKVWSFNPGEIVVPQGATVDFILTSEDVIHGFRIPGTTVNAMIVPGQVTRMTYQFKNPGEYPILCHEYCGSGHHLMTGKVIVEEGA